MKQVGAVNFLLCQLFKNTTSTTKVMWRGMGNSNVVEKIGFGMDLEVMVAGIETRNLPESYPLLW
jgi:hypothetical protein